MWDRIEPLMPADSVRGRRWADHRRTLEAIAWKYRTNSPWRDLPEELGSFQTAHKRLMPFTYRVPEGEEAEGVGWPASLANFPLGQWIADNRRFYARGEMDEGRVEQLEKLGMVWSHFDVAWEEGLAAARGWAEVNGHLLAPLDATFQGYKVGIWLKNQRAAARKAQENEQQRGEALPVESWAGALTEMRREQLEDIDPIARKGTAHGSGLGKTRTELRQESLVQAHAGHPGQLPERRFHPI